MNIPLDHITRLSSILIHTAEPDKCTHFNICIRLTINHKSPCHTLNYTNYIKHIQIYRKNILTT